MPFFDLKRCLTVSMTFLHSDNAIFREIVMWVASLNRRLQDTIWKLTRINLICLGQILAINTYDNKRAYSINPNGSFEKVNFEFGMNTEVDYSCSLQWQNNYYVFGGHKERRQVSVVNGNRLERKATLNFECSSGACTVLNQKTILLCFGEPGVRDECRQSNNPLESFTKLPKSNYNHWKTRIASFEGKKKSES